MNAAVLGAGRMGTVIAKDLADSPDVSSVVVGDVSRAGLDRCAAFVKSPKLSTAVLDVSDRAVLVAFMTPVDVVAGALPHAVSFGVLEAAIDARRSLNDELTFIVHHPSFQWSLSCSRSASWTWIRPIR